MGQLFLMILDNLLGQLVQLLGHCIGADEYGGLVAGAQDQHGKLADLLLELLA